VIHRLSVALLALVSASNGRSKGGHDEKETP
jgi:hypothetical protein